MLAMEANHNSPTVGSSRPPAGGATPAPRGSAGGGHLVPGGEPPDVRYYEDVEVGREREVGRETLSADDITAFAEQYDPLPYHLDPERAREAGHDGLIASGYQTLCVANRLIAAEFRRDTATVAGIGVDDLRWHRPVQPGDELVVHHEVVEKRPSESRPGQGIVSVDVRVEVDGEPVMTYSTAGVVKRRDDA